MEKKKYNYKEIKATALGQLQTTLDLLDYISELEHKLEYYSHIDENKLDDKYKPLETQIQILGRREMFKRIFRAVNTGDSYPNTYNRSYWPTTILRETEPEVALSERIIPFTSWYDMIILSNLNKDGGATWEEIIGTEDLKAYFKDELIEEYNTIRVIDKKEFMNKQKGND